ncbi:N-acetyltransferase [Sphaerisporangium melleum]|uniref:N-acetyltransferase n=1 Tax=Sphaerisporangium melleum TaxID=321316 RepID=A0A917VP92_9ACTN|nr:N-acetyltransferase [Sphaerisporangium melleum]GGL01083.1 N-acetyltransferase [Sphaerisporangium melleum]GII71643.1 N-acetyltransferase [Sphaerisporangium melleum]
MLVRRELPQDAPAIRRVHDAAFAKADAPGARTVEAGLVEALRDCDAWSPPLSLVATAADGGVIGHVVCTRAFVDGVPVLGLGPLGVLPEHQRRGVGHALMHAVLGAADALDEPLVVLLGHRDYYPRFGFRRATELGVIPPDPGWDLHFQARPLTAYSSAIRGSFVYAEPFQKL